MLKHCIAKNAGKEVGILNRRNEPLLRSKDTWKNNCLKNEKAIQVIIRKGKFVKKIKI